MAWALLTWWYSRGLGWWSKGIILAFVVFTVMATLGSGEHYLVDLDVAFPFALMVQGIFALSLSWKDANRLLAVFASLSVILAWLALLRFANPLFWISPLIPWTLAIVTIVASIIQRRRLAVAVDDSMSKIETDLRVDATLAVRKLVQT
jgi:hypothetical protein